MAKEHINRLSIKRFKSLEDITLDLAPFSVFIGSNNSGKSSIIQALHFLISLLQSANLVRPWDKVKISSISPDQIIYSPSRDPYALASGGRLVESEAGESDIVIQLVLNSGDSLETHIRKGKNNNIGIEIDNQAVASRLASLSEPFTIFSPGLAGIAKAEPLQSDGMLLRALARGDANVILRNIIFRLFKKPKERDAFLEDMKQIFSSFDLSVEFNENIDEFIGTSVRIVGTNSRIPLELAGTGLLQAVQILAYIHLYSPNLIVLDEPDSHLHPNNQRVVCALLSEMVVERGIQVVLTTHSRHVLDATVGEAKVFWMQKGQAKHAEAADAVDVLLDMGALDVKETLEAAKPDILIVTEDKLLGPLEVLVEANNSKGKKVAIKSYFGARAAANTKALVAAIKDFSAAKVLVHRDRDYMSEEDVKEWEAEIRKAGAEPFVTVGTDVESYFASVEHLQEVNPEWTQAEVAALVTRALADRKEAMREKAVNWMVDYRRKSGNKDQNVGKIAGEVNKLFEGPSEDWSHGKELLAGIRHAAEGDQRKLKTVTVSTKLQDLKLSKALGAT